MTSIPDALPIEVSCREVHELLGSEDEVVLVDCREPAEHVRAALEVAMLLPMSQLPERAGELDPHQQRRVIVLCHLGGRSLHVANWLRERGFSRAQSLAGGIDQWAVEIDPSLARY